MKKSLTFVTAVLLLSVVFSFVPWAHGENTFYVAPTGSGGGSCSAPNYNGIQAAVTAAGDGDTILVCQGTYEEQVVISTSLTLIGKDGKLVTIIKAPANLAVDSPNGFKNIVTITGSTTNVGFSGFTVTGPGPGTCGSINTGIFVRDGATANIHDNRILDIRDNPLSGCQNGQGIFVGRNFFNTAGHALINDNYIIGYQKGGIVVDGLLSGVSQSTAEITDNVVTGVGQTETIAQNGIQISRGAAAVVRGNNISENYYTGPECILNPQGKCPPGEQTFSTGLLLYQVDPGSVKRGQNNLADNQRPQAVIPQ